jgi:hypothetical protein
MDTWLSNCRPRFILGRRVIAEGRVPMGHELTLECPEEALDACVILTMTVVAHTGRDAVGGE